MRALFFVPALVLTAHLAAAAPDPKPAPATPPCDPSKVSVTQVTPATATMEGVIVLRGTGFDKVLACVDPTKPIVLFLDGLSLDDVLAEDAGDGGLRFRLERGEASKAHWDDILGRPRFGIKPLPVSLGLKDGKALESKAVLGLIALPTAGFLLGLGTFVALGFVFIRLAISSNIIRNGTPAATEADKRGPFSLARTQAAWWFFVVLAAYLFIGLVTGDFTTSLNSTALTLLAIGGGTAFGAALIGSSQNASLETKIEKSKAAASVTSTLAAPALDPSNLTAAPTSQVVLADARKADAERAKTVLDNVSQGFLIDILSDADGVCFHRFQNVGWTIVLTGVFAVGVYEKLAMPNFDPTLLGLLGLSSATYLGLKTTEAVVPSVTPPASNG